MANTHPPDLFKTWSEIAGYLGISVREAQYRETNEGLPIRHMGGKKPRVWALRSDLDAWLNAETAAINRHPNPLPDLAPANVTAPPPAEEGRAPNAKWGRRAVLGAAGLAAAAVGSKLFFGTRKPRVKRAVLTGDLLTALDGLGSPIWTHRFSGDLDEPGAAELRWRVQVIDLEGSGSPGVLAVCRRVAQAFPAHAATTDELWYFGSDGEITWTLPCRPNLTDFDGSQFEPAWTCSQVIAVPSGKQLALWVAVHHYWRWPGCVIRVDARGAASVQFANAGFVELICRLTRPNGEFAVIAGANNAFDRSFAAILGVGDPPSCSPAGGAARYHFANGPSGTPRDYILFPTNEMLTAVDAPYGVAMNLNQTNDGGFVVWVSAGDRMALFLYEFSGTNEPKSVMPSDSCATVHRRLEAEGKLNHSWAACPELQKPLTIRHWRRANGWQDERVPWRATSDRG
jgi:hypothetical protein